ncbi:hypothetical protein QC761_0056590 [Podospora bellae-mahoneyi]|uniref:Uncharacterized protein n=1 Tax=Podospora bellae-mahoneyi TaxID=2093777 RepID=A0ABR0FLH7_9PEZI|nr:hypothetical protein QC761_0056590 [Podospora bellae-mahoneyi]
MNAIGNLLTQADGRGIQQVGIPE